MAKRKIEWDEDLHIDLALAHAQEENKGKCLTTSEISELTGLRRQRIEAYYHSGLKKIERILRTEMNIES